MKIPLPTAIACCLFSLLVPAGSFGNAKRDTTVWINESTSLQFVIIEPGSFLMGSPGTEPNRDPDEGPVHEVKISKPFYLCKFETTQRQFEAVMGYNPSIFDDFYSSPNHPVENLSWKEADQFIKKLNELGVGIFRMPTEAEWEYACRAGTQTPYYWGTDMNVNGQSQYTWANSRSMAMTHPVGEKKANAWGLYDMSGNVWEWCSDWYGPYDLGFQVDPQGMDVGKNKVFRGGSWYDFYESHRSANRHRHGTDKGYTAIGFRIVMEAK